MVDLNKIEAAAKAATPGEWQFHSGGLIRVCVDDFCIPIADMRAPYRKLVGIVRGYREEQKNGQFIALANPATVLEMVEEIRRLREALKPFAGLPPYPPAHRRLLVVDTSGPYHLLQHDFDRARTALEKNDE